MVVVILYKYTLLFIGLFCFLLLIVKGLYFLDTLSRKVASVANYCSYILFCRKDIQIWNDLSLASSFNLTGPV